MMRYGENEKWTILKARPRVKFFYANKSWLLFLSLIFALVMFMRREEPYIEIPERVYTYPFPTKYDGTWRNLTEEEKGKLSVLGRILYLEESRPAQNDKDYLVLIWKYGMYITDRHLKRFTKKTFDPLDGCSVKNCKFSLKDQDLEKADAVIFHLHKMKGLQDMPKRNKLDQIWTFLTDESPFHTFTTRNLKMEHFNGKFNWSMTYRMDSDVPVPYGRFRKFLGNVTLGQPKEFSKRKDKLVTILGSNCGGKNHRWSYVKKLNESIGVDVYGKCGNKTACPGHIKSDCTVIDNYLFYLSFENSDCKEYITEKVFWNAFHKNSIPIIMGYNRAVYEKLLPYNSFLHVDDFASPKDLADYIRFLNDTGEYKQYYKWKDDFEILNEHGYFQSKSYHFCRMCEALNFNSKEIKLYDKLNEFWSIVRDCSMR